MQISANLKWQQDFYLRHLHTRLVQVATTSVFDGIAHAIVVAGVAIHAIERDWGTTMSRHCRGRWYVLTPNAAFGPVDNPAQTLGF